MSPPPATLTNKQKMLQGDLFDAWTPEMIAERKRCNAACHRFNNAGPDISRREEIKLWRSIIQSPHPLPPPAADEEADTQLFASDPHISAPVHMDYGYNVHLGPNVQINQGCTFIDTCAITIGARTLVAPKVSFYSGAHPLDPMVRDGMRGPEMGREIWVGEDCWIGGGAILVPGVRVGRGVVVGAGSVVTRDVPDFHVVAGNPARVLRKIETSMSEGVKTERNEEDKSGKE